MTNLVSSALKWPYRCSNNRKCQRWFFTIELDEEISLSASWGVLYPRRADRRARDHHYYDIDRPDNAPRYGVLPEPAAHDAFRLRERSTELRRRTARKPEAGRDLKSTDASVFRRQRLFISIFALHGLGVSHRAASIGMLAL